MPVFSRLPISGLQLLRGVTDYQPDYYQAAGYSSLDYPPSDHPYAYYPTSNLPPLNNPSSIFPSYFPDLPQPHSSFQYKPSHIATSTYVPTTYPPIPTYDYASLGSNKEGTQDEDVVRKIKNEEENIESSGNIKKGDIN